LSVEVASDRGVAVVTIDRQDALNALDVPTLTELRNRLRELETDAGVRAVVLTGAGEKAFVAGADIKYMSGLDQDQAKGWGALGHEAAGLLETMPKPTIAAINGFALGGGCELALSCDFRVLADTAKIGLPETKIGAVAGAGGVQKLLRHVGRGKALDWILRGSHLDAATANRWGLCSAVVPGDELMQTAIDLAVELRQLGPRAVAQSKRSIYVSEDSDLRTARRFGIEALSILVGGDEWKEGMGAFNEKRKPTFDRW
jgi:enoyl-CoA hydratase